MKRKLIISIALLLVNFIANAQSKKDFETAVDYCACKIAYAYTNQYASKNPDSEERISFVKKIKPEIENCDIDSPMGYSDVIELLERNNYQDFSDKLLPVINQANESYQESFSKQQAINTIIDKFYKNQSFNIVITTYSDIEKIEQELRNELGNLLSSFPDNHFKGNNQRVNDESNDELITQVKRLEKLIESNKTNLFSPNWLSVILIVIISILLFVFFKLKIVDIKERLDRHREAIDSLKSKGNTNQTNFRSTNNNQFERSINRSISDLNDSISKLQNEVSILSQSSMAKSEIKSIQQPREKQEKRREILFAPAPNSNGSFNVSIVTQLENQSSSFFKFTLLDGFPQKAEFEFINNERAIKDALSSYELILKPVCKFNNALNQNAKKIITSKVGLVEKQNDKWIVKNKAEITYE